MSEPAYIYDPRLALDDLCEIAAIHEREIAAGKRVDPADRAALAQAIARLEGEGSRCDEAAPALARQRLPR